MPRLSQTSRLQKVVYELSTGLEKAREYVCTAQTNVTEISSFGCCCVRGVHSHWPEPRPRGKTEGCTTGQDPGKSLTVSFIGSHTVVVELRKPFSHVVLLQPLCNNVVVLVSRDSRHMASHFQLNKQSYFST